MAASSIEWTDATWNPVTGCTKVSPGCKHCYAERMAERLHAMGQDNYRNGFELTLQPHMLGLPLRWKKPRMIFVNSMSDLFHRDVPFDYINRVFEVMEQTPQHVYQVLTKRSARMLRWFTYENYLPPPNVWFGVSVEDQERADERVPELLRCPAAVRWVSAEPLLGPVDLGAWLGSRMGISWVVAGGESGPGARPMNPGWATDLRDQCLSAKVPFFFKQWGGVHKKLAGRHLDGRLWDEMPARPSVITA